MTTETKTLALTWIQRSENGLFIALAVLVTGELALWFHLLLARMLAHALGLVSRSDPRHFQHAPFAAMLFWASANAVIVGLLVAGAVCLIRFTWRALRQNQWIAPRPGSRRKHLRKP